MPSLPVPSSLACPPFWESPSSFAPLHCLSSPWCQPARRPAAPVWCQGRSLCAQQPSSQPASEERTRESRYRHQSLFQSHKRRCSLILSYFLFPCATELGAMVFSFDVLSVSSVCSLQ